MSKHIAISDKIQTPKGDNLIVGSKATYEPYLTADDFDSDDAINKRAAIELIGSIPGAGAFVHTFPVTAGVTANPLVINFVDWPEFNRNTLFIYRLTDFDAGNDRRFTGDLTIDELKASGIITGLKVYGHDDGSGFFAETGQIVAISAPDDSGTSGGSALSLLLSANEWLLTQTFDSGFKFKRGSNFVTVYTNTLTGDRTINFPDKNGTVALTTDIPQQLNLGATGDGLSLVVSIAHGLSGVSSTSGLQVTINSLDAGPYDDVKYFEVDATNLKIHYKLARVDPGDMSENLKYKVSIVP